MKISELYTYAPKSKIKASSANNCGKYQFFTSSSEEGKRCDNHLYDGAAIIMGTGGSASLHYYNGKFATSTDCLVLMPNERVISKYLYYYFLSNVDQLEAGFHGAGLKHTSKGYIDNLEISNIPNLDKQRGIVTIFDSVESNIKKQKYQITQLDTLVKAQFVEMFGSYDLTPQFNEWIKLSDLGEIVSGSTPKTAIDGYWSRGDICWISPAELKNMSGIINDSAKKITELGRKSCSLRLMPKGTVILSSRAPIGKVAILGKSMCCSQGFKNIICNERILPIYLYYLLAFNTKFLNSLGRGATFKELSKAIVENIRISLPPLKEQQAFSDFVSQVDKSKFCGA